MPKIAKRDPEEMRATAWHEAGHVTARFTKRLPVRYATLRPRGGDALGFTAVPARMRSAWDIAVVAHAGPIAQGMYEWRTRAGDDGGLEEQDYVLGAYLAGGSCDLAAASVAPQAVGPDGGDLFEWSARRLLEVYWPVVTAIAEGLLTHMTLSGTAMKKLAADAGLPEGMLHR